MACHNSILIYQSMVVMLWQKKIYGCLVGCLMKSRIVHHLFLTPSRFFFLDTQTCLFSAVSTLLVSSCLNGAVNEKPGLLLEETSRSVSTVNFCFFMEKMKGVFFYCSFL